jgi:phosphoadenosine phosphosulfate reductase
MTATASVLNRDSDVEELKGISDSFEGASPEAVLYWAAGKFGDEVALATGFGAEGCVLIDMLARVAPSMRVFYLDTDLLFPETYVLVARLQVRYGIRFERRATRLSLAAQAEAYGERLWERDPEECCRLRKVEPLRQMLAGLRAWVTAIRREQTTARAGAGIVEHDAKFGLVKINPLAAWSERDVWDYITKHDVPYNPLHDLSYTSIGCVPCTTPVRIGEDPRAGRWRGLAKTECGLHR